MAEYDKSQYSLGTALMESRMCRPRHIVQCKECVILEYVT